MAIKYYNFKKAERLINRKQKKLLTAQLGIDENWYESSDVVWEPICGFTADFKKHKIMGVKGSFWGSPILVLTYKDGKRKIFNCYGRVAQ